MKTPTPKIRNFALFLLLCLAGCGGSGSSSTVGTAFLKNLTISVDWPAQSRESVQSPSSALSAVIVLPKADPSGNDITFTVNRGTPTNQEQVQIYPVPGYVNPAATALSATFYAQANGVGSVVGAALAFIAPNASGLDITNFVLSGAVKSVIAQGTTFYMGDKPLQLTFSALTQNGSVLVVVPGAAFWTFSSGGHCISLTSSGLADPVAVGASTVAATVDGVASAPVSVTVLASPPKGSYRIVFDMVGSLGAWAGYSIAQDGAGFAQVTPNTGQVAPYTTPDSRAEYNVYFAADLQNGDEQLFSIRRDQSTLTSLVPNLKYPDAPSESGTSGEILYADNSHAIVLWTGGAANPVTQTSGTSSGYQDAQPSFSANGLSYVFVRKDMNATSAHPGLGIYSSIVSPPTAAQFITGPSGSIQKVSYPHFSPDGKTVVFSGSGSGLPSPTSVFTVTSGGANLTNVTSSSDPGVSWTYPCFSPDGTKILFVRGGHAIYSVNPDGSGLKLVYEGSPNKIGHIATSNLF